MTSYPHRMLVDCRAAIDEFQSSMAMLTNQDYLTEELLEPIMFALLERRLAVFAAEIADGFAAQHAIDGEEDQARVILRRFIDAICAQARPHQLALESARYRYEALTDGLIILERID